MRWLALIAWLPVWLVAAEPLRLPEVLTSVKERYPPLLIAMIEQDNEEVVAAQVSSTFNTLLLT